MRLIELKEGTAVQIVVGVAQHKLEFYTTVTQVFDTCIYVEPIMQDDKLVGFSNKGLIIDLIVTDSESERAFLFSGVKIRGIKTERQEIFHEISTLDEAKPINRRGACRVWLGEEGMATYGLGKPSFPVTVKDISVSGIAFICSKDVSIPDGSIVHVNFVDEPTGTTFSLAAIIVRSMDMENSRIMYGCKLNQESNAIAKFVNEKQRDKLKAARQSSKASYAADNEKNKK